MVMEFIIFIFLVIFALVALIVGAFAYIAVAFEYICLGFGVVCLFAGAVGFVRYSCREFKKAYKQMEEEELNEVQRQKIGN